MEPELFDGLVRSLVTTATRRRLFRVLTSVTLPGLLTGAGEARGSEARVRTPHHHRAQPHHRHRHGQQPRRRRTRQRRAQERQRDTHAAACIPTGQRCPSRKFRGNKGKKLGCAQCCQGTFTTEANGKKVCGCQPNGGACATETVSACCSGFCNGATCQAAPCSAAIPCPQCQSCNGATGLCEAVADGTACDDGDACTQTDSCQAGVCAGANPVTCPPPSDQCHAAGVCDRATGICSNPNLPDGTACDDGDPCTRSDVCRNGVCQGTPLCAPDQICQDGVCGVACGSAFCPAATTICDGGICQTCTVTCDAPNHVCAGTALQTALTAAGTAGGTVVVCAGRYTGSFTLGPTQEVTVIGAGQGDDPRSATILDALQQGRVLLIDVAVGADLATLERLRVTGGAIVGSGAGIYVASSRTLQVRDCTVTANTATDGGGGMYVLAFGLEMTRCTITDNHATGISSFGGGLHVVSVDEVTLTDCLIADNNAGRGGGIYFDNMLQAFPHTLAGNTAVRGNTATLFGGGIYQAPSHYLDIGADCRVTRNTAPAGQGGGIYAAGSGLNLLGPHPSPIVVDNCHENCVGVPGCAATPVSCP